MYNIGEYVFDAVKNERVQILDRFEVWGFVSYKVFNPSENAVYKISQNQIIYSAKKNFTFEYKADQS